MTSPNDERRYIFLMRHARHSRGHLTEDGSAHVRTLATRFAEWVQAEQRTLPGLTVRLWYTSAATEVLETADLFTRDALAQTARSQGSVGYNPFAATPESGEQGAPGTSGDGRQPWMPVLVPRSVGNDRDLGELLSAYTPDEGTFRRLRDWLTGAATEGERARRTGTDAPLLVGNAPLIEWLAGALTARDTPVAHGELACLVQAPGAGRRWRLLWTISDDREAEAEAIRTKIKSKMSTAGALGAVIVGLTTFLLQNALQKEPTLWQWMAFAALGASAALYFCTLFLYDTLQMPPRFWASTLSSRTWSAGGRRRSVRDRLRHGRPSVRRPPSSAARLLQASMVQIWVWIFTPGTMLAGVGVACLAIGAARGADDASASPQFWQVAAAILGLVALVGAWVAWHRPDLGASD